MLVLFRRPWYFGEVLYKPLPEGVEVDDALRDKLPSTAKILGEDKLTEKEEKAKAAASKKGKKSEPVALSQLGDKKNPLAQKLGL